MHKFFHFAHLKSTFSILHTYFYKTPTSVCLFYTFIQIKYSFLYPHPQSTPVSHRNPHNPPVENQKNKPSNKIDAPEINTTQQHNPHNPATRNRNKPNNTIHTTHPESTPRLEQQDRHLRWRWRERETRSTPPKASGGDGDGERHSTPFNPKPTDQPHSTRKQRETNEEKAIGGGNGDRQKLEEERLMRGRKIDQVRGRKKELCVERERGS